MTSNPLPALKTNHAVINKAFRIALGDIIGNILPYQDGELKNPKPCLMAGLEYNTPWTRDSAINTWNGAGLLFPKLTHSTLLSVLERQENQVRIGGQYWDAIIWAIGGWYQYLFTGDTDFLNTSLAAIGHSLTYFESTEFSPDFGLFRGPACYGDGVAAYPDRYAQTDGSSSILDWPNCNPKTRSSVGFGIPMHTLSTNCLYYQAYRLAEVMAETLGMSPDPAWHGKATHLLAAIQKHFWNPELGTFSYLIDDTGICDAQEGMGHAFVLLFDIATSDQATSILKNQHITRAGIPCVWPSFARYDNVKGDSFGRHSGTVWPHIQALYADAALRYGRTDIFDHEFFSLAQNAWRDTQFTEIYHPITGEPYGGMQEDTGKGIRLWKTCKRQTWSATGFLRMVLFGLAGMSFKSHGIDFAPYLPETCGSFQLSDLPYRNMILSISILGTGRTISSFHLNGKASSEPFLDGSLEGPQSVEIRLK